MSGPRPRVADGLNGGEKRNSACGLAEMVSLVGAGYTTAIAVQRRSILSVWWRE